MNINTPGVATGLSERLRNETRALHTEVERGPFMHAMLRGQLGRPAYCRLLRNLHPIYEALETALVQHATDALVAPVYFPALFRSKALERDLDALHGNNWQREIATQAACRTYVTRLHRMQKNDAALLVAHAYVRYLGDLSGGQMLKRIVADSLQIANGAGTAFYDVGDAIQTTALTQAFRSGLRSVPADEAQTGMIVAEAVLAFELHRSLFRQLDLASRPSTPSPVKAP